MAEGCDQWLGGGDCSKCRRNKHCGKPCKASKQKKIRDYNSLLGQVFMNVTMKLISDGVHSKKK